MLEIEFFERTQDKLNILTSIKNSRAKEYVYIDGEYKKLNMQEIPYALRNYHIHELFAYYKGLKNRKVHWVIPFEIDCVGEYHQIPYDEYKEARERNEEIKYAIISETDRLKLQDWVIKNRNIRYDIYEYECLNLVQSRTTKAAIKLEKQRRKLENQKMTAEVNQ